MSTKQALQVLATQGMNEREIAVELGVSKRHVGRLMVQYGLRKPKPVRRLDGPLLERAREFAAEGVPANWIAETLGFRRSVVERKVRDVSHSSDWYEVWPSILKNPTLHELHQQFAPSRTLRSTNVHAH